MPLYPIPNVPDSLARQIYADLLTYLPLPPDDTPEARLNRDSRAMAAIAALIPENAAEAEIAITAIATDFHAKHTLAAASRPNLTIDALKNLLGMTASMSRQSQNALRTLRLMQAERRKLGERPLPRRDGAIRPLVQGRLPDGGRTLAGRDPATNRANRRTPQARPGTDGRSRAVRRPPSQPGRRHPRPRRRTPNCDFTPPDPKLVAFIVASKSPLLLELDQPQPHSPPPLAGGGRGEGAPPTHPTRIPPPATPSHRSTTLRRP